MNVCEVNILTMSVIFVLIVFLCGSLADSDLLDSSKSCLLSDLNGVDETLEHGKDFIFECNLGSNIQGKQYAECVNGVWYISPCIGNTAK